MNLYRISYKNPEDDHWVFCDAISSKERVLSSAQQLHEENPSFEVIAEEEDWEGMSQKEYDWFMEHDEHEGFAVEFTKDTGYKSKLTVQILSLSPLLQEEDTLDERVEELGNDIFGKPQTSLGAWFRKEWIYILAGLLICYFFLI